jgi:hypothetical protein
MCIWSNSLSESLGDPSWLPILEISLRNFVLFFIFPYVQSLSHPICVDQRDNITLFLCLCLPRSLIIALCSSATCDDSCRIFLDSHFFLLTHICHYFLRWIFSPGEWFFVALFRSFSMNLIIYQELRVSFIIFIVLSLTSWLQGYNIKPSSLSACWMSCYWSFWVLYCWVIRIFFIVILEKEFFLVFHFFFHYDFSLGNSIVSALIFLDNSFFLK